MITARPFNTDSPCKSTPGWNDLWDRRQVAHGVGVSGFIDLQWSSEAYVALIIQLPNGRFRIKHQSLGDDYSLTTFDTIEAAKLAYEFSRQATP